MKKAVFTWFGTIGGCYLAVLITLNVDSYGQSTPTPTPTPTPVPCVASPTPTATAAVASASCPSCPPTPTPYPSTTPAYVEIPSQYQARDGADLAWVIFTPSPTATPTPTPAGIVLIHGGAWRSGDIDSVAHAARTLAKAGYYVAAVEYELAPCGLIYKQPCHQDDGSYPDFVTRQTNDIKAYVTALQHDSHVDPTRVAVIGGSSGGTLAAYVALDTTNTGDDWPYWNVSTRPKCAVMLSGAYDMSDWTPVEGLVSPPTDFIGAVENFAGTTDQVTLKSKSPVSLVQSPSEDVPAVPLFMINSQYDDPVPYHQILDMLCTLQTNSWPTSSYRGLTIPNSEKHAFGYWDDSDGQPGSTNIISDDVIAFLQAHL